MQARWRSFWTFCTLTLLLLALVPALSALFGTSMDFAALGAAASEETGVPWTSNLWNVIRLSLAEPGLWLLVLGSTVPTLAALVTLAITRDRPQWNDLGRRLCTLTDASGSWKSALGLYAALVLGIVACLWLAFEIRAWVMPSAYARAAVVDPVGILWAILVAAFLDQGAVLEEGGWRGFATPLLQGRVASPLATAVLVGTVWALWHVPRDVVSGVIERLGYLEYALLFLPAFALGCITTSILASYFMNRCGGSLLPAIMVHGLTNDAPGLSGVADLEQALTPLHQLTKALPLALLAALLVKLSGRQLGLRREEA